VLGSHESLTESANVVKLVDFSAGRESQKLQQVQVLSSSQTGPMKTGRASSCPPRAVRSVAFGPLSLEWLGDQHHSEVGVVSLACKGVKKVVRSRKEVCQRDNGTLKRKKVNGVVRHSVHGLKKVARLPNSDRAAVLQILKKKTRRLQGSERLRKAVRMISKDLSDKVASSDLVNKEWNHWVVLHGNDKVVEDDVKGIWAAIGVQLTDSNMFGVLSRKGKGKKKRDVEGDIGGGGSVKGV